MTKQKRSERLKALLRAPVKKDAPKAKAMCPVAPAKDLALYLPGPFQKPLLNCFAEAAEDVCMARAQRAARCRNPRTCGSFCKKHFDEVQSQKYRLRLFDQLPASEAMDAWERSQMEVALSLSLEDHAEIQKKDLKSAKKIDQRLKRPWLEENCHA